MDLPGGCGGVHTPPLLSNQRLGGCTPPHFSSLQSTKMPKNQAKYDENCVILPKISGGFAPWTLQGALVTPKPLTAHHLIFFSSSSTKEKFYSESSTLMIITSYYP